MKKGTVLLVVVAFVAGTLVAVIVSNVTQDGREVGQAANQQAMPAVDLTQQIKILEEMVQKDPANRRAWVQLGHRYFDSQNPVKAIEAYDKALAIDQNDPDVLTDQAIMYREVGWFDKAIENFQEANRLNPQHANSLFNMGIVYMQDLGEREKAKESFRRFLDLVPTGPSAERARRMIEHLEGGHE